MMKKSIWKMKRNSIVRRATKSVSKEFRPLIKSAILRPSNIQHIRDSTVKFLSQDESLYLLGMQYRYCPQVVTPSLMLETCYSESAVAVLKLTIVVKY